MKDPLFQFAEELYEQMSRADKKALKKDYKFQQSKLEQGKIPSFEELWDSCLKFEAAVALEDDESNDLEGDEWEEWFNTEAKEEIRSEYDAVIERYQNMDGHHCWRTVSLEFGKVDPVKQSQLGVYWAIDDRSAEVYFGDFSPSHNGSEYMYEAVIDTRIIDWPGTLCARLIPGQGEAEQEIRFIQNAKIWVKSVTSLNGTPFPDQMDLDKFRTINDWRRV